MIYHLFPLHVSGISGPSSGRKKHKKILTYLATQEIPRILWKPKYHYAFISARQLSLTWASSIQSIPPHLTSWRSILILSPHLCLGLPCSLLHSGFHTKTLYTPLLSPIHATCPAHVILVDIITQTIFGQQYRSPGSSLRSFLHSPVTPSLIVQNISLGTLFPTTLTAYVHPLMWETKYHSNTKQ